MQAQPSATPATSETRPRHSKRSKGEQNRPFVPSVSHPVVDREIEVGSVYVQRLFDPVRGAFKRMQITAYSVLIWLPQLSTLQETAEAEGILNALIEKGKSEFKQLLAILEAQCGENGIEGRVRYSDPVTIKLAIYTPAAARCCAMLLDYDRVLALMDTLWFNGVFDRAQRDEGIRRATAIISDIVREMGSLQKRVTDARERKKSGDAAKAQRQQAKALGRPSTGEADATSQVPEPPRAILPASDSLNTVFREVGPDGVEASGEHPDVLTGLDDGDKPEVAAAPARAKRARKAPAAAAA